MFEADHNLLRQLVYQIWIFPSLRNYEIKVCCYTQHPFATLLNTMRPRQNGRYFADDIFKLILLYSNGCILILTSLKFVPKFPTMIQRCFK